MRASHLALCAALVGALFVSACGKKEEAQSTAAAEAAVQKAKEWVSFRDAYIEEFFKAHPTAAVGAGRHEFDGQLPDWSAEGIAAEVKRLHAARDKAAAIEGLAADQIFERDYLVARIDRDLFWLETAEAPFRNPTFYLDWALDGLDPSAYLTREYAPLEQRMRAYIGYSRSIPRAASQIRANLRTPLPQTYVERGIGAFGGFADFYEKELPQAFESVKDEALHKEFAEVNKAAIAAMRDLAKWLEGERKNANQGYALGAEKFAQMLQATERVDTPLAEIEAVGRADMKRNQEAMKQACEKYAPGAKITACIAKARANKPEGGPVQGARDQLAGLKQFLIDKQVVTIPSDLEALVNEAPPYNRANFAYIDIPGPYEKALPSVYYISPPDPSWPKAVQRDYLPGRSDLLFTSVHEVWPGHFLNFLHSNRSGSITGKLFVGYAFAEGWAHYSEEMMWEMGLANGRSRDAHRPALQRAAAQRALSLRHRTAHRRHERRGIGAAVPRGGLPGHRQREAAGGARYLRSGLPQLHDGQAHDPQAARGLDREPRRGKAWREFHDKFLSYGGPPIPMVRESMLGTREGSLF